MLHIPADDIGNRFDPAMGVPRKAVYVSLRAVRPEIVEQKEWIKQWKLTVTESPSQMHASSFNCGFAHQNLTDFSRRRHLSSFPFDSDISI
jgi:hypothetical protein